MTQEFAELDVVDRQISLGSDDHLLIQSGQKHRVIRTDTDQPTIWLAIHFDTFSGADMRQSYDSVVPYIHGIYP